LSYHFPFLEGGRAIVTPAPTPAHPHALGVSEVFTPTQHGVIPAPRPAGRSGRTHLRPRQPQTRPRARGSYLLRAPEDAYAGVRSPTSQRAWVTATAAVLATPAGEAHRRRISIKASTFMAFVAAEAATANRHTGRNIATSHDTLARTVGRAKITARRARALMEALGCLVTIRTGRYLLALERLEAADHHGGQQLRAASLRALNMPETLETVTNEHLATASRLNASTYQLKHSPKSGKPHSEAATRPQHRRKRAKFQPGPYEPRPLALQKLAAQLVYEIPWLPRDTSTLRVQRIIYRSGFDGERFRYADLIRIWFELDKELRQTPKEAGAVNDPEAYLATRMKLATNYVRWFNTIPARKQP